ncbi:DUF86 domain-containing protein [Methylomonas sp. SURF-2]|uniref:DUF86 domain-containing protein n=1 Tax=Methylomonas subterranea TaxID=2952225 RepID=A0ABT1TEU7_9GAMM|nr:HepT-like ribonuclease domain-containing protein [Methylomonas sp. SURF-2]MCQ8103788.1 DUF86 domain-containing protein [Methylomonas sp. SURF-2]
MQRDPRVFLWDAHFAAEAILEFVAGKTVADYRSDRLLRSAVERQFEIIGEALNQLCKIELVAPNSEAYSEESEVRRR